MKFMGMKHPKWEKVQLLSEHMIIENTHDRKRQNKWIFNGEITPLNELTIFDKKTKSFRAFKFMPAKIRGYRINKPGLSESLFAQKYSRAVDLLCCAIFENGYFTGKVGAKIEAVR